MTNIDQVLLVAGTHGNELSGIYLQKLIKDQLFKAERPSFSAQNLLANPEAVKRNVRFVDSDLNREFSKDKLRDAPQSIESKRAHEIVKKHAATSNQLVIDLHNTTSNMGATLILLDGSAFYKKMGAYVKQHMPEAYIIFEDEQSWEEQAYLCSIGKYGIMLEIGAQAHGSLKHECLESMKKLLATVLDYIELHNQGTVFESHSYEAYRFLQKVKFPLDSDGMRQATVHPSICGKDFEPIKTGQAILKTFKGADICWQGAEEVYPNFINESAYAAANVAMELAEKVVITT